MGHTEAMPVAVEAPRNSAPLPHKRWTRQECAALERAGVDLARYELIEGELVEKMPKNHRHMLAVLLAASWLRRVFGEFFVVTEATIDLRPQDGTTNQPEPDVIVLTRSFRDFSDRPRPTELRLIIEVASSTLAFDLTTKARLYARSEIAEYWVIDLESSRIVVHRDPQGDAYASVIAYREDEAVNTLATPGAEIRVADLLK